MNCLTIEKLEREKCSGCGACVQLCPTQCISMEENGEGFYYPRVNSQKCVSCGKCLKQCPQYNIIPGNKESTCYAVIHNDSKVLKTSTSGGAFSLFAKEVIEKGGAVYGCSMEKEDNTFVVRHIRVDNMSDLEKIKGSKYVQSIIGDTFLKAKEDLEQNRMVLFSGTPCQIAGLKAFMQKDYPNLITCEVICHGVPSQKLFQEKIKYIEQDKNKSITVQKYLFRSKIHGWAAYSSYQYNQNGMKKEKYVLGDKDPYYMSFINGNCSRESCYLCQYARKERVADITLGDCWGIEEFNPEFADPRGVSVVLINNPKAEHIFERTKKNARVKKVELDLVVNHNKNLVNPTIRPVERDFAYEKLSENSGNVFEQYPYQLSIKQKIKADLKSFISVKQKWAIKGVVRKLKKW